MTVSLPIAESYLKQCQGTPLQCGNSHLFLDKENKRAGYQPGADIIYGIQPLRKGASS